MLSIAVMKRGPSCRWMARWIARRKGTLREFCGSSDDETEVREDKDAESERELREEVEVEWSERGGDGEGEGGGEVASERISLGMGPNIDCCEGVR